MDNSISPNNPFHYYPQDKELVKRVIIEKVEKGTNKTLCELRSCYTEEKLFAQALMYVTTTKKALCKALRIEIDNACRIKRELEKEGGLMQSFNEVVCPYTGAKAHLISTNPSEFPFLDSDSSNQLNLFDD